MTNWIRRLAQHYESVRHRHPDAPLALVFDIDGTILDVAPAARDLLRAHDEKNGTDLLATAREPDIATADWRGIVECAALPPRAAGTVENELRRRWNHTDSALAAHQPFRGVLELIRWFQLQPGTHVALNTARPECQRLDTLRLLNSLGREFRVRFTSDLLFMRADADEDVSTAKTRCMASLEARGYRIVAAVDNEPAYLADQAEAGGPDTLLAFRSGSIHESRRQNDGYDLRALLGSRRLPRHIQFVWQRIGGEGELQRFLTSSIHWGEVQVSGFLEGEPLVGDGRLSLARALSAMLQRARRCKVAITEPDQLRRLIPWLQRGGYPAEALWLEVPDGPDQREILRRLAETLPGSIRQCPVDGLRRGGAGRIDTEALRELVKSGATRFSLDWRSERKSSLLDQLDALGQELHLHSIPDLEAFLHASLLLPRSLGTGFDFPQLSSAGRRRAG
ncbi:hypothetical protein H0Z60_09035 [Ectothiorhodospiraceae bacterium WFHF3C12]|nr:hypothetical protein [Ectothiorhodospiraceae bacterium WFHF3C12]